MLPNILFRKHHFNIFPKQCSHCRGSGGDSGTGRLVCERFGRSRRSTFVRRRGTSCMSPRSRAGEMVGRATFFRKTQWFQHTFPLSADSPPGGPREIFGGSRRPLDVPPGGSGGAEPLLESFFQGPSSRMPTLRSLFKWSFLEIPLAGFPPRIPLLEFPLEDSSARIPLSGFLLQDFPAGFRS